MTGNAWKVVVAVHNHGQGRGGTAWSRASQITTVRTRGKQTRARQIGAMQTKTMQTKTMPAKRMPTKPTQEALLDRIGLLESIPGRELASEIGTESRMTVDQPDPHPFEFDHAPGR